MTPTNPKDTITYTRLTDAIENAIQDGDSPSVICSVLLKQLIGQLLISTPNRDPALALQTLSNAINECFNDLKEHKLI